MEMENIKTVTIDGNKYNIHRITALKQGDALNIILPILGLLQKNKDLSKIGTEADSGIMLDAFMAVISELEENTFRKLLVTLLEPVYFEIAGGVLSKLIENGEVVQKEAKYDLILLVKIAIEAGKYNFLPFFERVKALLGTGVKVA